MIPEQTAHVARAAFPKGNPYMRMRDALGPIYTNPDVAHLFPNTGQPAEAPAHMALVTIMQFAEGLSDEQTATLARPQCTQSKVQPRLLQVRDQAHYEVLQAARERQKTELFKEQYAQRAGIEGTISQGTSLGDLRRSRYRGLPKTRLLHLLIAAALNFMRVAAWLAETPRARTRQSAFSRLAPAFG
ncbi:MAG: transposase [Chloroflexales bacterium]